MKAYTSMLRIRSLFRQMQPYALHQPQIRYISTSVYKNQGSQPQKRVDLCKTQKDKEVSRDRYKRILEEKYIIKVDSLTDFKKLVFNHDYPTIVLFQDKKCENSQYIEKKLKQYLMRAQEKFRIVVIDIDEAPEVCQKLNVTSSPSLFLFYRQNIAHETRGIPVKKELIKEVVKSTLFLNQIANEENLLTKLMKEGKRLNVEKNYEESAKVLSEALSMGKWKELYGATIISNLAFACAKMGDVVKSKYYLEDLQNNYAAYGLMEEEDIAMVQEALLITDHTPNSKTEESHSKDKEVAETLKSVQSMVKSYQYEEAIDLCLNILKDDFSNGETHETLMGIFSDLGSPHKVVKEGRLKMKEIMLERYSVDS